jgi:UDP-N-acetylmuramoylalanine-D-glutamate ligase
MFLQSTTKQIKHYTKVMWGKKMNPEDKQFAVIGLGRFGMSLCAELSERGAQVLARCRCKNCLGQSQRYPTLQNPFENWRR